MNTKKPLTIRKEQLEAFQPLAWQAFEARMRRRLAVEHPDEVAALGHESVGELIRVGVEKAGAHGMVEEFSCFVFLRLMLLFGRDFDTSLDWARRILSWVDLPCKQRAVLLRNHSQALVQD